MANTKFTEEMFSTDTLFNITPLSHQLCTQPFIFCLKPAEKTRSKILQVADITSINTHYRSGASYLEFQLTHT
jgi:hypothetical protein